MHLGLVKHCRFVTKRHHAQKIFTMMGHSVENYLECKSASKMSFNINEPSF